MYQVGELVLHEGTGVCRVKQIVTKDGGRAFYELEPLYQNCVIFTPVDGTKVFMRPIISREEANRLIDSIPSIHAEAYNCSALRQLSEHYTDSLKSFDCAELIAMTMSIYAKKQNAELAKKKFGLVDERYMRRAEDLLFGELAAALEIPRESVQSYIAQRLRLNQERSETWNGCTQ